MNVISLVRILSSYNELLAIWTSVSLRSGGDNFLKNHTVSTIIAKGF